MVTVTVDEGDCYRVTVTVDEGNYCYGVTL